MMWYYLEDRTLELNPLGCIVNKGLNYMEK